MKERIKVLSIIGTRPEAIKMAPVIKALEQDDQFKSKLCVTAQHRELLDQVLDLFSIKPDFDLNLMKSHQTLKDITVNVLEKLEPILDNIKPHWVLIQGDTTTVMATALLAYYKRFYVGHVEAGLRTYDIYQPFPEEVNRRVAGIVSNLHFSPTVVAANNLIKEGTPKERVIVTGNTVIDAIQMVSNFPFSRENSVLATLPMDKKFVLITAHRRENFGKPLENICLAIKRLAEKFGEEIQFIYPVHPNPNVRNVVYSLLGNITAVSLIDPISYREMAYILKSSVLVLTDSGGLQEEAPALKKPVLVMREKTERPEGIAAGISRLVGTDPDKIFDEAMLLITSSQERKKMTQNINPYGDGQASKKILKALRNFNPS